MIAALEYVYDLDFRHQQLEDFVLHAVAAKQKQDLMEEAETVKMTKTNKRGICYLTTLAALLLVVVATRRRRRTRRIHRIMTAIMVEP